MAFGKKDKNENEPDTNNVDPSLRTHAEEQLARTKTNAPDFAGHTPEELIHELQVHQIELETQAEELRQAYRALEESRDKYLDLYEFAPLGYLTLSDKGIICEVNLTGAALLGVVRKDLIRARFSTFVTESDGDTWYRYFKKVQDLEGKQVCALSLMRGDGSVFPARLESIRIPGTRDGPPTVRVAVNDITDLRRAGDALRISNKKLNLLSGITRHDINNQLFTINAYLEIIRKNISDPSVQKDFARITAASDRMAKIILFTKEYEQVGAKDPAWQNCHFLVDRAARQADPGNVLVKNDLPAGLEIFADPLVAKVFYNLIDNAARHGGKITTIRFFFQEAGELCIIVCEDDGDGVAADEKELIFERGFGKNTGLGLTLSREILAITGITIRETGEPGKGARFEITVMQGASRIVHA